MVCDKMGFTKWQQVSGQTYTRKLDYMVLSALSGLAQSAYKMCGDIRLLASMKEIGMFNHKLPIFISHTLHQRYLFCSYCCHMRSKERMMNCETLIRKIINTIISLDILTTCTHIISLYLILSSLLVC
jgi:hypothetical protein